VDNRKGVRKQRLCECELERAPSCRKDRKQCTWKIEAQKQHSYEYEGRNISSLGRILAASKKKVCPWNRVGHGVRCIRLVRS